jgi:hypothetical protein
VEVIEISSDEDESPFCEQLILDLWKDIVIILQAFRNTKLLPLKIHLIPEHNQICS